MKHLPGMGKSLKENGNRRLCFWLILTLSLLTNLVLMALSVYAVFRPDPGTSQKTPLSSRCRDDTTCFDCDDLSINVSSESTFYTVFKSGNTTLCCLKTFREVQRLIKQMILHVGRQDEWESGETSEDARVNQSREVLHQNATGVHLFLDSKALFRGKLSWKSNDHVQINYTSPMFHESDYTYIPQNGLYLVYTHITFSRQFPGAHGGNAFRHLVTRYNRHQTKLGNVPVLVAKNSYPTLIPQRSSFLHGVLRLRTDDQIGVSVSETDTIHRDALLSYFGIIKL